ncbi:MAG TPA: hypothetical protein VMI06_16450 [Terriglobia bacterium]|nr:hypothetical protein [Terriglobia bacterium]
MFIKARTKNCAVDQRTSGQDDPRQNPGASEEPAGSAVSHSAAGIALVEVILALALSVIVLGAAFDYFNDAASMTQIVSVMSGVNENLNGAAALMAHDLYAAGTGIPSGGIPLPNGTGSAAVKRPGAGSATFPVSTNNGVLSVITPGSGLSGTIDGQSSDEVTILKEDPVWTGQTWSSTNQNWSLQSLAVATVSGKGNITYSASTGYTVTAQFQASTCSACSAISAGDLLLFTTASEGYALGMVTTAPSFATSGGITTATITFGSDPLGLNQACAASGCTGSIDSLKQSGSYPAGITLTKIDMTTYYLANSYMTHSYVLMRQVGNNAASPVAYGISYMHFTYDAVNQASPPQLDASDPNPTCASTQCPNDIRTVHLTLSATSSSTLRESGQYYQNSIVSSITLQNLDFSNQFPMASGG